MSLIKYIVVFTRKETKSIVKNQGHVNKIQETLSRYEKCQHSIELT